jgi:Ca2+-transporting ATPase
MRARTHTSHSNKIKGGRSRASSVVRKSRYSRALDEHEIRPSALMAMVPSLVATSLGGGWRPDQGGSLSDPASIDPSRSSAALYLQGVSVHPDTDKADPLVQRYVRQWVAYLKAWH